MGSLTIIRRGRNQVEYRDRHTRSLHAQVNLLCDEDEDIISNDNAIHNSNSIACSNAHHELSTELLHPTQVMRVFRCSDCAIVVADHDDIIAKSFFGRTGKAFLMNAMFNVTLGEPRNRYLMTGIHTICDVFCTQCQCILGWKYV